MIVFHLGQAALFNAATQKGRLYFPAVILSEHRGGGDAATLVETFLGVELKRVVAGLLCVFMVFFVHYGLLFDVLIGSNRVGNEATGSNIIDVVI